MLQSVESSHGIDAEGHPAGGQTVGCGIEIAWQNGPLGESRTPNGAFVEGVIQAAIDRLEFYQKSKFSCRENAIAITKLQEAMHWLQHRTADRERRGVEGTHQV